MKLISCYCCGTVIDTDRLMEPDTFDSDTGECTIFARLDVDGEYKPIIYCPQCHSLFWHHSGDNIYK